MNAEKPAPFAGTRAALTLTLLSILSPATGMIVEMLLASHFGASGVIDAYRIASLLLLLGNQFLGAQLLSHIIIPLFCEYKERVSESEAWRLAFSIATALTFVSLGIISFVFFQPGMVLDLLGPGLTGNARAEAQNLVFLFSIVLVTLVWTGTINGIFNVFRIFWLPPIAQFIQNLSLVVCIPAIGGGKGSLPMGLGICAGAAIGLIIYISMLYRIASRNNITISSCFNFGPVSGLKRAFRLAVPIVGMTIASQWSIILINRHLSRMAEGSLAEFGFAFKLLLLVAVFSKSVPVVIFPALSESFARNDKEELQRLVIRSIRMTIFLVGFLSLLFFFCRASIAKLFFGRGAMTLNNLDAIARIFGILVLGAPFSALIEVFNKISFSLQDSRTPAIMTVFSALFFSIFLFPPAMHFGSPQTAAVFSIGYAICSLLFFLRLNIKHQILPVFAFLRNTFSQFAFLFLIFGSTEAIKFLAVSGFPEIAISPLPEFSLYFIMSVSIGILAGKILGIQEPGELIRFLKWQTRRIVPGFSAANEGEEVIK